MEIRIDSLLEGAKKAEGTVVIVDVFRAFTTAAVALSRGASKIILVGQPHEALELRDKGVGDLCMGEVNGKRPEAFDFGNSPHELSRAHTKDKALIQSTRAGTAGATSALKASAIYVASLVVAKATVEAIMQEHPPVVTIVAMGHNARTRTDEDELCALYIRNLLQQRQPDPDAIRRLILSSGEIAKYYDPQLPHFDPRDCEIALDINRFDFAIKLVRENNSLVARPHP